MLGCEPSGTEALKNLVLPGIKGFCIIDDQLITTKDTQTNFFTKPKDINQYRA